MRPWVRSEYAPELAVLSAWMATLIPWNVTYASFGAAGDLLYVRFPLFQVVYRYGVPLEDGVGIDSAYGAWQLQADHAFADAYLAWVAGAVLVGVAALVGVALYAAEERIAPYRPVPVVGALLVLAGLAHATATVLLASLDIPGVPVPIGVLLELALGGVLLLADRA